MFRGCERGIIPIIRAKGFSSFPSCNFFGMQLGAVSLTFRELPKIFSQGFGHTYKVSAWNSHHKYYLCSTQMSRYFLGSSWNVSETTPRCVSGAGEEGRGRSWLCWFTVFSRQLINAMSVLGLLTGCSNGLAVGAILKRMLYRLYGLCVGRCSLCQLVRNSDVKKNGGCFSREGNPGEGNSKLVV